QGGAGTGSILLLRAAVKANYLAHLFFKRDDSLEAQLDGYVPSYDCSACNEQNCGVVDFNGTYKTSIGGDFTVSPDGTEIDIFKTCNDNSENCYCIAVKDINFIGGVGVDVSFELRTSTYVSYSVSLTRNDDSLYILSSNGTANMPSWTPFTVATEPGVNYKGIRLHVNSASGIVHLYTRNFTINC
ncbi:MAG: hypothetical protein D6784_08910, partial [Chloroflexi bacterium]